MGTLGVRTTAEPPLMLRIGTWVWKEMKSRIWATALGVHVVLKDDAVDSGSAQEPADLGEKTAGVGVVDTHGEWLDLQGQVQEALGVRRIRAWASSGPELPNTTATVTACSPCPGPSPAQAPRSEVSSRTGPRAPPMSTGGSCGETTIGTGRGTEARREKMNDREEAKARVRGTHTQRMKEKREKPPSTKRGRERGRQTDTDRQRERDREVS